MIPTTPTGSLNVMSMPPATGICRPNMRSGAPTLQLAGGAAARLAEITPAGHEAVIHLTLTDDHPWAQAFVVIEARGPGDPVLPTLTPPPPARM